MNNDIQINQKLLEREDRLVEIFDLERQINGILGGEPYPLAPPDTLPSLQKRKKSKKRKTVSKKTAAKRVRKLDSETESAYRIEYRQNDKTHLEIHTDPRPLALLLNTELPTVTVDRIETVQPAEDGDWTVVDVLYERDAS